MPGTPDPGRFRRAGAAWLRGAPLLALVACAPAAAQTWGGSLGLASDNLYRGISLNAGRPAWLADLHVEFAPGWVAGAGAAAARSAAGTDRPQYDIYLDRRWRLDEAWAAKLGVQRYDASGVRYDEANVAIGYRGRWTASLAVSPNAGGDVPGTPLRKGTALWAEATLHQPLAGRWSADLGYGYARLEPLGLRNYRYANAGLDFVQGDLAFYLSRLWTGPVGFAYPAGYGYVAAHAKLRWVATALWSF
jgi:hypothetical protein